MRIATWNINKVNKRLALLLAWLNATRPDAVALRELKSTEKEFPRPALEVAGYATLVAWQKSWHGVALLCLYFGPIETRRALPGDPKGTQVAYLEAAIYGAIVACPDPPNRNP